MEFRDLMIKGKTMKSVYLDKNSFENEAIVFVTTKGTTYVLTHITDCSESVVIESIDGDLEDLIGEPLVMAEEAYQKEEEDEEDDEWTSSTWSFYKFATIKGYVTVRFFGQSNGWYSEMAGLYKLESDELPSW